MSKVAYIDTNVKNARAQYKNIVPIKRFLVKDKANYGRVHPYK